MKIGYYFPGIVNGKKTWETPSPKSSLISERLEPSYQERRFINWDSIEALEFIESLFEYKNLSIENNDASNRTLNCRSNKDLYKIISLLKLGKEVGTYYENSVSRIADLIKDQGLKKSIKKNLNLIDYHEKVLLDIIEKELNLHNIEDLYFGIDYYIKLIFDDLISQGEIEIRGFKLESTKHGKYNLYKNLGYFIKDHPITYKRKRDGLSVKNDDYQNIAYEMQRKNLKMIDDFNANYRNNTVECLNSFYVVKRTNNYDDVLYLSPERSLRTNGNVALVFRDKKIKRMNSNDFLHDFSDIMNSGNDFVFFNRILRNEDRLFLEVTDKPLSGSFFEERWKEKQPINRNMRRFDLKDHQFGLLEVLEPRGKKLSIDNPLRVRIEKSLKYDYILEGFKISNKNIRKKDGTDSEYKYVIQGSLKNICASCSKAPCCCNTILLWENYWDANFRFVYSDSSLYGFSVERSLEQGDHPSIIRTCQEPPLEDPPPMPYVDYIPRKYNEDGLDWSRYNDQLDMDQQDPEFWG